MNTTLPITVTFTLALANAVNNRPCLRNPDNNAYNKFVNRHIIQDSFNRRSEADWGRYIRKMGLCNRPKQSFFELSDQYMVMQICNGHGHPLLGNYPGNLCMSDYTILEYDMDVNNNCIVQRLVRRPKKVIVACDKVANQCRPVHFERYTNQQPNSAAQPCQPGSLSVNGSIKTSAADFLTVLLCFVFMVICFQPYSTATIFCLE